MAPDAVGLTPTPLLRSTARRRPLAGDMASWALTPDRVKVEKARKLSEQEQVLAVADAYEDDVAEAVYAILSSWRDGWTLAALRRLLAAAPGTAADALDPSRPRHGALAEVGKASDPDDLAAVLLRIIAATQELPSAVGAFTVNNPYAAAYAATFAAQLVQQVDEATRYAIRRIILRGQQDGWNIDRMARALRDTVALHDRQAQAVVNLRDMLNAVARGATPPAGLGTDGGPFSLAARSGPGSVSTVAQGMTQAQIDAVVSRYADRALRYRARMIARTETVRSANAGLIASWRQAQADGYIDGSAWVEWVVNPDERLCSTCASMGDQSDGAVGVAPVGGRFTSATPGKRGVVLEPHDQPPAHPNCVIGSTVVGGPKALGFTRRWVSMEVVEVTVGGGDILSITENHPVLTPEGWVPAGELREGDSVIRRFPAEGVAAGVVPHDEQEPARIGDLAASALRAGGVAARRMPAATVQFHGDGTTDGEVDVVWADGSLVDDRCSGCLHPLAEQALLGRDPGLLTLDSLSAGDQFGSRDGTTAGRFVGGGGVGSTLLRRPFGLLDPIGVPYRASGDSVLVQPSGDGGSADSVPDAEGVLGLTGEVEVDEVLSVRRVPFSGHVYNAETEGGWYTANSIVVHNCRCTLVLHVDPDEARVNPRTVIAR